MALNNRFSDEMLAAVMPIVTYWVASAAYELLAHLRPDARLNPKEEEHVKNIPSRRRVITFMLLEHVGQLIVTFLFLKMMGNGSDGKPEQQPSLPVFALQMFAGMVIVDTVQYFGHRAMHVSKFLYKHLHSLHHGVLVPYPYAALYSHPIDGFLLDIVGALLSAGIPRMTSRTAMYFFCFATLRTVDIHCGLWLPWSPSQLLFSNSPAFHDTHHQLKGHRYNFAQPFFLAWDKILGTYMPFEVEKRKEGGYQVKMLIDN